MKIDYELFESEYEKLIPTGLVDDVGSAEYFALLRDWFLAEQPYDVESFIRRSTQEITDY